MDAKQGTKQGPRSYTDFEPSFEWSRGQESDILRVHLPGFKREQIKVQVDSHGTLRTTGERPIEDNRWRRFGKDFRVPKNSKVNGIRAKYENETLFITVPKDIDQAQPAVKNQLPIKEKPAPTLTKPAPGPAPAPALAPAPAPVPAPAPAPTPALAPVPKAKLTNSKLSDLIDAEKEDEKTKAKNEEGMLEKKEDELVQEKIREMIPTKSTETMKEGTQRGGEPLTGLRNPRKMLILNVLVAMLVLVGIGFYMNFKLRRGVVDEEYGGEL